MKRKMNWKIIESNVREAREELESLEKLIADKKKRNEIELQISLQHAYHHLNFAWHIRRKPTKKYGNCSNRDFKAWGQFPQNFWWD